MAVEALCIMHGDDVYGVLFLRQDRKTKTCEITGKLKGLGLRPGPHGLHIHECSKKRVGAGCKSTGFCFNPRKVYHGAPTDSGEYRHIGDLGNIFVDSGHVGKVDIADKLVSLVGPESIVGKMLVLHQNGDDYGLGSNYRSKLNGNVGFSLACGVIRLTEDSVEMLKKEQLL